MNKAIFKFNNGNMAILCSKCRAIIKTGVDFNEMEKFAAKGVITLLPQYCLKHKYMNLYGQERELEKRKMGIKEKLREAVIRKNMLGVDITRPDQELIIMRGIPGSGKSTKTKSLLGKGVIHSTDDLIDATGDYNGYFKKMVDSGDWSEHGRMHNRNFINAKVSMKSGITPVIIDNTNIKASEPKKYVEAALKLGFDENNIKIIDVGDGGVSAEDLAKRNTHNVPLKTIQRMMSSHKGVGPLTVDKILQSEGGLKNHTPEKILYSAVVLDGKSKSELLTLFGKPYYDKDWKLFAHHMTIVFGKGLDDKSEVGKQVNLVATHIGKTDKVVAVKVEGYPSSNATPHITIVVNVNAGGKPFQSNEITKWVPLKHKVQLTGTVEEIKPS